MFGLVAVLLIFSACSKPPAHLKTISADSPVVVSVDLTSLAWKGELQNFSKTKIYRQMKENTLSDDPEKSKKMQKYADDPFAAGVNFLEDMHFFIHRKPGEETSRKDTYFCLSMELSDPDKFALFLADMVGSEAIEAKEGYQLAKLESDLMLGWTNDAVILMSADRHRSADGIPEQLGKLLTQPIEQSVMGNANFVDFLAQGHDIGAWISTTGFKEEFEESLEHSDEDLTAEQLADNYMHAYLDFEEGSIKLVMEGFLNKALPDHYRNHNGRVPDEALVDFVPGGDQTYVLTSLGWDLKASEKLLRDRMGERGENTLKEFGFSYDDLFHSLTGDMVFAIPGFEEVDITNKKYNYETGELESRVSKQFMPQMVGVLGTQNGELTEKLIKAIQTDDRLNSSVAVSQEGGIYRLEGSGPVVYLVQQDAGLIITNSSSLAAAADKGGFTGSDGLSDNLKSSSSSQNFFGYVNLNYDNNLESAIQKMLGGLAAGMVAGNKHLLIYDGLYLKANETTFEAELKFHEKKDNSLVVVIDMIDQTI